jgi:hypothetical protein
MPGGRPPKGPDLVDRLDGSDEAKHRLKIVLETIQGKRSVREAIEILGISETRFHAIREKALAGAVASLEPGVRGRPPSGGDLSPKQAAEMEAMRQENEALKEALAREKARADVAEIMAGPPPPAGEDEKKNQGQSRAERRRALKAERKALEEENRKR